MIKQVIVVRKDLNMRKGKIAAQVAHASMKVFFDRIKSRIWTSTGYPKTEVSMHIVLSEEMNDWIEGKFTKIVVSCKDIHELKCICIDAHKAGIPYAVIEDEGLTEFNGVKTTTCVAIGPDKADEIDLITKGLPLL